VWSFGKRFAFIPGRPADRQKTCGLANRRLQSKKPGLAARAFFERERGPHIRRFCRQNARNKSFLRPPA
jgi:hypothetical protein